MKVDWMNGVWTSENNAESTARLTIASDWMPLRAYEDLIRREPLAVYGDLLPILRKSDLNVVNVECTLGSNGQPIPKGGPNFRAQEDSVGSLSGVPFHVACLANNHIMDYGPESLHHTINVLQQAGMQTVGAGMTGEQAAKPLFIDVEGSRVSIINCAEGEECRSIDNSPGANGFNPDDVVKQIQMLKRESDIIIVIFHGGREYTPLPPEYVVNGLRKIAKAGATLVVAHHPHVPQGIELCEGVPIVYSQGNFVFWQDRESFYNHAGYLVHLDISKDRLLKMEITPYLIERSGLTLMKGNKRKYFLQTLEIISKLLSQPDAVKSAWNAFSDFFGMDGLQNQLETQFRNLRTNKDRASAILHNLFFTPASIALYVDITRRASTGDLGKSPDWAKQLVQHWHDLPLAEGKEIYENKTPLPAVLKK